MSTLWLVRHGRTAWNAVRFLGRADVALDEHGRAQATGIAHLLAGEPIEAVYSSPLSRARDTAHPLAAARGLTVDVRAELAELDCGDWEGTLKAAHPVSVTRRDPDLPVPGGESLRAVHRRAARMAHQLRRDAAAGRDVAVVGHYLVNQLLVATLLGRSVPDAMESRDYRPPAGSVYELVWDGPGAPRAAGFRSRAVSR